MELNTSSFCYIDTGISHISIPSEGKKIIFFFKEESYLVAVRRKGQIRPGQGDFLGAVTVVHSRI